MDHWEIAFGKKIGQSFFKSSINAELFIAMLNNMKSPDGTCTPLPLNMNSIFGTNPNGCISLVGIKPIRRLTRLGWRMQPAKMVSKNKHHHGRERDIYIVIIQYIYIHECCESNAYFDK